MVVIRRIRFFQSSFLIWDSMLREHINQLLAVHLRSHEKTYLCQLFLLESTLYSLAKQIPRSSFGVDHPNMLARLLGIERPTKLLLDSGFTAESMSDGAT